jgi:hypothetical protein
MKFSISYSRGFGVSGFRGFGRAVLLPGLADIREVSHEGL